MKAFWCDLLKRKCYEINSNQKLIKVDALETVKECLITFIEPKKHDCHKRTHVEYNSSNYQGMGKT